NGFFKSPDGTEDWIVYHGVNNPNGDCGRTLRTTRIQKFTWNADNTPNLGAPLALTTDSTVPSGEGGPPPPTPTPGAGPIHRYQFEGNASDSGSSVANGTLVKGPTFVIGRVGQAVNLAGGAGGSASQHVSLPAGIVN